MIIFWNGLLSAAFVLGGQKWLMPSWVTWCALSTSIAFRLCFSLLFIWGILLTYLFASWLTDSCSGCNVTVSDSTIELQQKLSISRSHIPGLSAVCNSNNNNLISLVLNWLHAVLLSLQLSCVVYPWAEVQLWLPYIQALPLLPYSALHWCMCRQLGQPQRGFFNQSPKPIDSIWTLEG